MWREALLENAKGPKYSVITTKGKQMSLVETLMRTAQSQMGTAAAQKTGLSEGAVAQLMPMAMSVLMSGLQKNAGNEGGAAALANALDNHSGDILDQPEKIADDAIMADGARILEHVLGGQRGDAEAQLAKLAGGVDKSQVNQVLAMAAPALLGALGKAKKEQGLGIGDLARLVDQEGKTAAAAAPSELSSLMKMLDADGDGNLNNEAIGMGRKILGGLFGRK